MTYAELRKKDVICMGDGRLLGRIQDLEIAPKDGKVLAILVPGSCGGMGLLRGDKGRMSIPYGQIACIGDDVILVAPGGCT